MYTLPYCVITFQYLRDSCRHQPNNKNVSNDSHGGPPTTRKGMYFNRSHLSHIFLDSIRDKQKKTMVSQAYTNAVCPPHHFISIIKSWRAGTSRQSHLEPMFCKGRGCGTKIVVHHYRMPFIILWMFFLFILGNHKRKKQ